MRILNPLDDNPEKRLGFLDLSNGHLYSFFLYPNNLNVPIADKSKIFKGLGSKMLCLAINESIRQGILSTDAMISAEASGDNGSKLPIETIEKLNNMNETELINFLKIHFEDEYLFLIYLFLRKIRKERHPLVNRLLVDWSLLTYTQDEEYEQSNFCSVLKRRGMGKIEIANNQRFMLLKLAPTLFIKYLSEILKNETFVDIDPEKTNAENLRRIIIHSLDVDTLVNKVYKKFGFERTDSFGATGPWIIARVTTILKNCEAVV